LNELKKWKVTINRWDVFEVRDVEAESAEAAEDIALEWFDEDFNVEHAEGGVNSIEAEEDEV
jgi:hypothetical protein